MRRPIINTNQKNNLKVTPSTVNRCKVELSGVALEKRLRQKRSQEYVQAMTKLDTGGVTYSKSSIDELLQAIHNEFPELEPYQYPVGIIAKCYLGHPFEVHTLDLKLDIINHYKKGEAMPQLLDRGRGLALHPSYEFIEIFSDSLRAVTNNGDVSVIKG
ncbi:hypothetical protein P4647_23390 [Peribacillus frigoritolerans]|uniref:hypothetical protein n=1 Tax=Peribacillus frigoritolerans TaxID=450367 RepID=UPI002E23B7DA|nr:hypothetical protein [Peribacillus frigoritolerans]